MEKTIYCGDEHTVDYTILLLEQLEFNAEYEVFTMDGEYHLTIKY